MSFPTGMIGPTGPQGPRTYSSLPAVLLTDSYGRVYGYEVVGPMIHVRLIPIIHYTEEEATLTGWKVRVGQHDQHLQIRTFEADEREQAVEWGINYANMVAALPQEEQIDWFRPPEADIPEPTSPETKDTSEERWWERFSTQPKGETA